MELNFLADLASDRRFKHLPFVIIGAYRDNEIGSGHNLEVALEYMKMNSVRLYTIEVLPLTGQEMRELLYEIIGEHDLELQTFYLKSRKGTWCSISRYLQLMFCKTF